jgi:hypothetical protein
MHASIRLITAPQKFGMLVARIIRGALADVA